MFWFSPMDLCPEPQSNVCYAFSPMDVFPEPGSDTFYAFSPIAEPGSDICTAHLDLPASLH